MIQVHYFAWSVADLCRGSFIRKNKFGLSRYEKGFFVDWPKSIPEGMPQYNRKTAEAFLPPECRYPKSI